MLSKLILTLDGEVINEYPVGEKIISIGRKHGNDIQLNDLTISGRHALITSSENKITVEDLASTNGTLVNGNHISKATLNHGDIIQIGHHQFTFLSQGGSKYEPTMFIKAEMDETQMVLPEWESRAEAIKGQPLAGLRTLNGPLARTVMELRKAFSTVGFQGEKLALISRGLDGYTISQITKPNKNRRGTDQPLLNGEPLSAKQIDLKPGDIINIAGFEVEFFSIH
ncbi:MAG: FHA domain-containing protein [Gammaproteobacteria bacterium]|nr:FHA domain-containing protein [Gammaproteobacteria bacterium]